MTLRALPIAEVCLDRNTKKLTVNQNFHGALNLPPTGRRRRSATSGAAEGCLRCRGFHLRERRASTLLFDMDEGLQILSVRRVRQHDGDGIEILFSDGTVARYPPEELAALRPYREPMQPERIH